MSDIKFNGNVNSSKGIGDDFNRFVNNYAVNNSLPNSVVGEGLKRFSGINELNQTQKEFAMTLPEGMRSTYANILSKYDSTPYDTRVATAGMAERFYPSEADYEKMKNLDLKPDTQEV